MKIKNTFLAATFVAAGLAQAAVSPEEAKQLGTTLTPWGASKAGNQDGSIPAYEGGLPVTTAPAGFSKDSGHWPDPFANEKPLYSVTAKNMEQYADKLSEATKEMLKRFPATYRLDVYPTHRTVNYPKFFVDNTLQNATRCKTIEDGLAVENCFGGTPFPIPKTGNEQMWNTILAYKKSNRSKYEVVYVDSTGTPVTAAKQDTYLGMPYFDPKRSAASFAVSAPPPYYQTTTLQEYPPRIAGDGTMSIYYLNPVKNPNKGWNYQQGNRRVRTIPDAQYDFPLLVSGGAQFFDEVGMFQGKMDRFDFKLVGKKEMLIPYSNYRAIETTKEDMTAVGGGRHPNPDKLRWELHRVNVVEATLKPGMRHVFAKRRFYMDEDYPQAGMADAWDHAGKPFKGYFNLFAWAYDKQTPALYTASIEYDLSTGIWFFANTVANMPGTVFMEESLPDVMFTPEGLTRRSAR